MTASRLLQRVRSDCHDVRRILVFSNGRLRHAVLAIPVILIAVVAYLVTTGILPGKTMIAPAEATAIVTLSVALAIALWRWRREREPYLLWLTCLLAVLVLREIHPKGSSTPVLIALVVVFYVGLRRYSLMAEYFASRTVVTLLAFVLFTYLLTEALDNHILAFIPQEPIFERPTEEVIEVVGHLGMVLLSILSRKGTEPLDLNTA